MKTDLGLKDLSHEHQSLFLQIMCDVAHDLLDSPGGAEEALAYLTLTQLNLPLSQIIYWTKVEDCNPLSYVLLKSLREAGLN